jgi:hypothetical protein
LVTRTISVRIAIAGFCCTVWRVAMVTPSKAPRGLYIRDQRGPWPQQCGIHSIWCPRSMKRQQPVLRHRPQPVGCAAPN